MVKTVFPMPSLILVREQGSRHATGCGQKKARKEEMRRKEEMGGEGKRKKTRKKESLLIINSIKWHLGYTGEERKILPNSTQLPLSFRKWKVPLHYIHRELILNRKFEI